MSETAKLLVTLTCPSCGGQILCEEGRALPCVNTVTRFSLWMQKKELHR